MSTMLSGAMPAIVAAIVIVAVLILLLSRGARRERRRQRTNWQRYMIRHRVLRDLSRVLWGPPRLPDLRDRPDRQG